MSYSLNSLKGDNMGDYYRTIGFIEGDTRSLDYSSHRCMVPMADFGSDPDC